MYSRSSHLSEDSGPPLVELNSLELPHRHRFSTLKRSSMLTVAMLGSLIAGACSSFRGTTNIPVNPITNKMTDKTYLWKNCAGELISFTIPIALYQYYESQNRDLRCFLHVLNPQAFITDKEPKIIEIAQKLTKGATSDKQAIDHILRFVRDAVPYDYIEAQFLNDYARHPVETLFAGDDCDGGTYLVASLVKAYLNDRYPQQVKQKYDQAILVFIDHVGLGISGNFQGEYLTLNGKRFYYAEARSDPADPGVGFGGGVAKKALLF
ncbi:MAG: hypothetical protein R3A13_07650 [Bdellovibrionota bacterium]